MCSGESSLPLRERQYGKPAVEGRCSTGRRTRPRRFRSATDRRPKSLSFIAWKSNLMIARAHALPSGTPCLDVPCEIGQLQQRLSWHSSSTAGRAHQVDAHLVGGLDRLPDRRRTSRLGKLLLSSSSAASSLELVIRVELDDSIAGASPSFSRRSGRGHVLL